MTLAMTSKGGIGWRLTELASDVADKRENRTRFAGGHGDDFHSGKVGVDGDEVSHIVTIIRSEIVGTTDIVLQWMNECRGRKFGRCEKRVDGGVASAGVQTFVLAGFDLLLDFGSGIPETGMTRMMDAKRMGERTSWRPSRARSMSGFR